MNSKLMIGLVVVLVGVGAGWYLMQGGKLGQYGLTKTEEQSVTETLSPTGAEMETLSPSLKTTGSEGAADKGGVSPATTTGQMTVTYADAGIDPKTLTVKRGATVRWVNQGSGTMWVASALHPTHQLLPGFDELKSVGKGGTYEYTFTKVGTWKYHNHMVPSDTGTVVVTE